MGVQRVGILTAGGIAPCLSAAIAALIEEYTVARGDVEILCYRYGYAGLLKGDSFVVTTAMRDNFDRLFHFGGSVLGNSRVKLTNGADCIKRGLIREGQDPQIVAAEHLERDGIDVLHTIGGDDTNSVAAQLADYLGENGYPMAVIGLPKTIDNDVFPITQTLGASTAAHESAAFFFHVANECTTAPRMLIVHEVMGRNCGWLTVEAAKIYRNWLSKRHFLAEIGLDRRRWDLHGVYIPEADFDLVAEVERLKLIMEEVGNVNLFISEGAGVEVILREMERDGHPIPRDAFGHVKLDLINPGKWFGEQLSRRIGAEKTLVQKSGYFARSSAPNGEDLQLIRATAKMAVAAALEGHSGVVGCDEAMGGKMGLIDFSRIRGGKPFDAKNAEFCQLLEEIGQR